MPKWTKQPKLTNNSLPLIAENKKITSQEFNELTGIVNDNFDLTVAPADQVYGKQGENFVAITAGVTPNLQAVLNEGSSATIAPSDLFAINSGGNTSNFQVSFGVESSLTGGNFAINLLDVVTPANFLGLTFDGDGSISGTAGSVIFSDTRTVKTSILLDNYTLSDYQALPENALITKGYVDTFVTLGTTQTITGLKTFPNTVGITDIVPKTIAVGGNGGLTIEHPQDDAGSFSIAILSINGSTRSYFEFKKTGLSAVMSMLNNASAPPSFDNSRGNLYVEAGALKYRGTSGTITTIANA
jgi:hypothetical protein